MWQEPLRDVSAIHRWVSPADQWRCLCRRFVDPAVHRGPSTAGCPPEANAVPAVLQGQAGDQARSWPKDAPMARQPVGLERTDRPFRDAG